MIKKLLQSTLIVASLVGVLSFAPSALALDPGTEIQKGVNDSGGTGQTSLSVNLKTIVNVLLYVLGAVSVIMIVIGGIRYTTSGGDSSAVTSAKNTVLYSVVGLIVALLAYAIVNWVISAF